MSGLARSLLVALLVCGTPLAAQEPTLADLLGRAGAYVTLFQQQLSSLVAEEHYVQDVTYRNLAPNRFALQTHRELRSDILLVRLEAADRYVEFRDVFEVDHRPVRDRQDRLTKLFLHPDASAEAQIEQINRESARYNIGNLERTVNTPTLALQVLAPRYQSRFKFSRSRRQSPESVAIDFEEVERPTLIRTTNNLDLPMHGRFSIDADTGRVVATELIAEDQAVRATIDVRYQWDAQERVMLPAEMRERYEVRHDGAIILGVATYGRIRRFQVTSEERLGPADPPPTPPIDPPPPTVPAPDEPSIAPSPTAAPTPAPNGAPQPPAAPVPPPVSPPVFKLRTDLVLVDFVVTDKSGRAVRGLSAKDVIVKEDGKERPIVSFEAYAPAEAAPSAAAARVAADRSTPASTIVLVDDVHLTPDQAARLRPALRGLLTTIASRSGEITLVSPASKVSADAGENIAAVVENISGHRIDEHTTFPIADAEAIAIARRDIPTIARVTARFITMNPELTRDDAETIAIQRAIDVADQARVRRATIYEVMLRSLDWLATRPGRHRLVLVSGGFATDVDDAKYYEVVTRSLRANAAIDVLDARGLSGFERYHDVEFGAALGRNSDEGPFGRFEAGEGPTGLAVDTGGVLVSNTNDMRRGLDQLLDSLATYYIVGYEPPVRTKRGFRRIKVEVRGKGLSVRARTGYESP